MKINHPTTKFFLSISLFLFAAFAGFAQEAVKPQLSRVSVTQVKPEMWEKFQEFYKNETLPALKKAGVKQSTVWRSSNAIGNSYEFRVIQPIENLAEFDQENRLTKALGAEGRKAYDAKRRAMITGHHAYIVQSLPELGIQPNGTMTLRVRREVSVASGRRADYESYQKDLLPFLKKAGLKGRVVSRLRLGGDLNAYLTSDHYASFAEYEKVTETLSKDEGYRPLLASGRTTGVITHTEISIYITVPELSIVPAPEKAASK